MLRFTGGAFLIGIGDVLFKVPLIIPEATEADLPPI